MSYYCHNCQDAKIQSKIEHCTEGLICKDCRSDFLEELNDQNYPSLVYNQATPASVGSSLVRHYQRRHPYSLFASGTESVGGANGAASSAATEAGGSSSGEVFQLRLTRRGGAGTGGASGSGGAATGGGATATVVGHGELDQLIQTLFQQVFGIVGDLDDYVLGVDSLDNVVTQLMNQLDGGGPPPATPDDLKKIQSVPVTEKQQTDRLQCSVCFDEFLLGCYVDRLPCQHFFHHDCILPWLEKHDTCPVCRKGLSGEDTTTQTFVDRRQTVLSRRQASARDSGSTSSGSQQQQQQPMIPRRNPRRRTAATSTSTSTSTSRSRDRSGGGGGTNDSPAANGAASQPMDED